LLLISLPIIAAPQVPTKPTAPATVASNPNEKPPAVTDQEPFLYEPRPTQLQSASPRWWSFAQSPDGKILAVSAGNHEQTGEILMLDMPGGGVRGTIKHTTGIRSAAFSPDGKTLAAGSFDNSLRLYDVATLRLKALGLAHTGAINSVAYSADGKLLVTGALDNSVMLWTVPDAPAPPDDKAKVPEFKAFAQLQGHSNWVLSIAISRDGKTIVSGSRDNSARIWDVPTTSNATTPVVVNKPRLELKGHANAVECVAISPDGQTIATGSWDGSVRTWGMKDGTALQTFPGHPTGITSVAFHKDGKELATACGAGEQPGGEVRRYELVTGKQIGTHKHQQSARCVGYSPEGENLISLGEERALTRVALKDHKQLGQIRPPAGAVDAPQIVLGIAYSHDGKHFAAAGENKKITVWNLASKESRTWPAHDDVVSCVAFSPDDKTLASASHDRTVKLWDFAGWKPGAAAKCFPSWE
jgi:WD40 repeat protein